MTVNMMKLYFQHSDGSMEYVCEVDKNGPYVSTILEDLYKRNPKFQSYYQRIWKDDNGWTWVDVGSHTEFYILKKD